MNKVPIQFRVINTMLSIYIYTFSHDVIHMILSVLFVTLIYDTGWSQDVMLDVTHIC